MLKYFNYFILSIKYFYIFQENMTVPNRLAVQMNGPFGSGMYKCEITIETPRFVTLELRKNITVIGKSYKLFYSIFPH